MRSSPRWMQRILLAVTVIPLLGCDHEPTTPSYGVLQVQTVPPLIVGAVGAPYVLPLYARGGLQPFAWSIVDGALPPGLELDPDGWILGRPRERGESRFTVEVRSADGQSTTQGLAISIAKRYLEPTDYCHDFSAQSIPAFEDPSFEEAVRAYLSIDPEADLLCYQLTGTSVLFTDSAGIESLVGLQNFPIALAFSFVDNAISDLSPVSGHPSLRTLRIDSNPISDLSPLSDLEKLTRLEADDVPSDDLTPLAPLVYLQHVSLASSGIDDVDPLRDKAYLEELDLSDNAITDVTALGTLPDLTEVVLSENPDLADVQPLLDNIGVGEGDRVHLEGTSVACADVAALEEKGVTVTSDCP